MNKLGRLAQWGKEKMGGDSKNSITDDFKALELEMNMRQEGACEKIRIPSSR